MARKNNCNVGDRFIPRRSGHNFQYFNINSCLTCNFEIKPDSRKFVNLGRQIMQKDLYKQRLLEAIGPKSRKVFNFSAPGCTKSTIVDDEDNWPVKPRKQPCIRYLDYLLDMPGLDMNIYSNVIDWSSNGEVAAIFDKRVYTWHPDHQESTVLEGRSLGYVERCLKFNNSGNLLAIALANFKLVVVNTKTTKLEYPKIDLRKNVITALEWLCDDTLIISTSKGKLMQFKKQNIFNNIIVDAHTTSIISIRKSCKERFLATSGMEPCFKIWSLPNFEVMFEAKLFSCIKTFAWHPWKETLIATPGGVDNNVLTLWNITSTTDYQFRVLDDVIDALTFNKLSAELIVSCYNKTTFKSSVFVLASFTKVSDIIERHTGRVPYLIWSADHKRLLTTGADETICIWDFFEKPKKQLTSRLEKRPRMSLNAFCIR